MKLNIAFLIIISTLFLGACDNRKEDVIENIKYDLSVEYNVPISDIKIKTIDYGISVFTTNQFKATIKSKNISFYLIDKNASNNYRRVPIK